jgi:hypothetical protein
VATDTSEKGLDSPIVGLLTDRSGKSFWADCKVRSRGPTSWTSGAMTSTSSTLAIHERASSCCSSAGRESDRTMFLVTLAQAGAHTPYLPRTGSYHLTPTVDTGSQRDSIRRRALLVRAWSDRAVRGRMAASTGGRE